VLALLLNVSFFSFSFEQRCACPFTIDEDGASPVFQASPVSIFIPRNTTRYHLMKHLLSCFPGTSSVFVFFQKLRYFGFMYVVSEFDIPRRLLRGCLPRRMFILVTLPVSDNPLSKRARRFY